MDKSKLSDKWEGEKKAGEGEKMEVARRVERGNSVEKGIQG